MALSDRVKPRRIGDRESAYAGFDKVEVIGKTAEQGCCHCWIDEDDISELVELRQHHDMAGYCNRFDAFLVSFCKTRLEPLVAGEAARVFDRKIGQDAEAASIQAIKTMQVEIGQLTCENDLLAKKVLQASTADGAAKLDSAKLGCKAVQTAELAFFVDAF